MPEELPMFQLALLRLLSTGLVCYAMQLWVSEEMTGVLYVAKVPTPSALQHNDTVMLDIETGKIKDFVKFGPGNLCMITGGRNNGRVGTITHEEKHKGSFEIVHIRDAAGAASTPRQNALQHVARIQQHYGHAAGS
jgi:ribosomal protein S4E